MRERCRPAAGFTLIELVVVVSLISLLLFFSLPRIQTTRLADPARTTTQWILGQVRQLKERSLSERKMYVLHMDIDAGRLWVTHAGMDESQQDLAKQKAFVLPERVRLIDVAVPDRDKQSGGEAAIYFTEKGYSDKAFIHLLIDGQSQHSVLIEPFLTRARVYKTYRSFER